MKALAYSGQKHMKSMFAHYIRPIDIESMILQTVYNPTECVYCACYDNTEDVGYWIQKR